MQEAIRVFEQSARQAGSSLDEIEERASSEFPGATQILDLCRRLREAKFRYQILCENIQKIQEANENLQKCINEDLIVTAKLVKSACAQEGVQVPSIIPDQVTKQVATKTTTAAPAANTTQNSQTTTNSTTTTKSKLPHPKTRSRAKAEPPKPEHEYVEITDEEFNSIPDFFKRNIKVDEIRQLHQYIFNFFYGNGRVEETMSRKDLQNIEVGSIKRKIESLLRCLKSLKRIQTDKSNNITQCL
ncbi:hypothetical protein TVAG_216190 [Trichomonas vaginalis G3]|uniref:Spindle and kinetochore-associated protein 2 n=1 Tax=Trichomonas vaginalis (strain ATCC PRA-98 / G3) TaxID=412133 RepID=A2ENV3_TRIV3|nr:spindle and kinetochore-associated protein 2 family [Trichomonas vaginalis G3]EAY05643.1 hypothetical protein TVAG_216190 [Trichomonas vaginalis G3]KAI5553883.1 spindle and kinetochore-associated protein 2 family [Trichomonas vaginalis G3]|eukprot:XP_001317866.1 hypothetical protein [Trichomonas vaginalis G3]